MHIKICGIKTIEAANTASDAGADLLGFVFAESKRKITAEAASEISKQLAKQVKTVGVFVNESRENIIRIAEIVGLDYIQLHGDESPEFCRDIPFPVIKALSIKDDDDLGKLAEYDCDYYLLDSPGVQYAGGSGIPFDWSILTDQEIPLEKIILAGGLNIENVNEAISRVRPAAIDVSSGVETNGEKDLEKIRAFIQLAKQSSGEISLNK